MGELNSPCYNSPEIIKEENPSYFLNYELPSLFLKNIMRQWSVLSLLLNMKLSSRAYASGNLGNHKKAVAP